MKVSQLLWLLQDKDSDPEYEVIRVTKTTVVLKSSDTKILELGERPLSCRSTAIVGLLKAHPGLSTAFIASKLNIGTRQVRESLERLMRKELVRVEADIKNPRKRKFFINESK